MAKRPFLALVPHDIDDAGPGAVGARTLIERAYSDLRDDIVEGVLAPGVKLRVGFETLTPFNIVVRRPHPRPPQPSPRPCKSTAAIRRLLQISLFAAGKIKAVWP